MKSLFLRTSLLLVISVLSCVTTFADNSNTYVIMRKNTGYTGDQWSYSGVGNELQTSRIKEMWDAGKRITNVGYSANGWFIAAAKNNGYTMQTYHYNTTWPTKWLNDNYSKDYFITSVAYGNGKWFIMMSQNTGYTQQVYFLRDANFIGSTIKMYWDKGFRITQACPYNGQWFVVMSENSPYGMQTYGFRNSYSESTSLISEKWKENYNITLWTGNGNKDLIVMSKFADGTSPGETYVSGTSPSSNIQKYWDQSYAITYVGGSHSYTSSAVCTNCNGAGTKQCTACNGLGFNTFGPCAICMRTGRSRCFLCNGAGRTTLNIVTGKPTDRYVNLNKRSSNFSENGIPNLNAVFEKYVVNDNWRIDSKGEKNFWEGESTIHIDVITGKTIIKVDGKTYVFSLKSIATDKLGNARFYFTEDNEEYLIISPVGEYCFIKAKSRDLNITLKTFKNSSEILSFMEKFKKGLAKD